MAAAKQKAFNPTEYKQEFAVLAQRDPTEAADVALKWRERFMNQIEGMSKVTSLIIEVGTTGFTAVLAGWLDGGYEAEREKAIADWELSGAAEAETDIEAHPEPWDHPDGVSDPTKLVGPVDKIAAGTMLMTILALFLYKNKYVAILRSAALGGFAYWSGNMANKVAKERKKEALEKKSEEDDEEEEA